MRKLRLGKVKILVQELSVVAQTVIPATQQAEIRMIVVRRQPGQEVSKTPFQPAIWVW
jgi:hypothetical protein